MASSIEPVHVYCGSPNASRGEGTRIGIDSSGNSDDISYASGRVAIVRSSTDPLACTVFSLHTHPVTCVRIAPDGVNVASGDEGGFIRVWERATLKQKVAEQVSSGAIRDIAFSADGKFVVISGDSRGTYAKAIKIPSAGNAGICQGHTKRVVACDIAITKPSLVATASEDMSVGLFKGPPIREIDIPKFLRHHTAFVNDVRFSPCGKMLAIASSDRAVSIVDVETYEVKKTLQGHTASVTSVSWSKDGSRLLSSGNDKSNRLWDVESGECIAVMEFGTNIFDMQVGCAILPKSGNIVSVALRGDISFRGAPETEPHAIFRGHSKQIVGLAVIGPKAYSADYSGLLVAWDVGTGSSSLYFNGKGPTTSVCSLAANDAIVANFGQDGKIFLTPTSTLTYAKPLTLRGGGSDISVPQNSNTAIGAVVINEARIAVVSPDGSEFLATLDFERQETGVSVACTPNGELIAIGIEVSGGAGELRFLKRSGSTLTRDGDVMRMQSPPNRLAFSPDGSVLAVGEKSRRVKMYDLASRKSLTGGGTAHTARVDAVAFSPDGTRVATGGMDGSIAVWPVDSQDDPLRFQGAHRNGVTGIGFSDASTLVTSGGDSCLRTWTV